jgi:hypothetical protein
VKKYLVRELRPIINLILINGYVKKFLVQEMQIAKPEILVLKNVHLTYVQKLMRLEMKILVNVKLNFVQELRKEMLKWNVWKFLVH